MIGRRRKTTLTADQWIELCRFQHKNSLAMARLALKIATEPELVTPEIESDLRELVRDFEDRLARFSEHYV